MAGNFPKYAGGLELRASEGRAIFRFSLLRNAHDGRGEEHDFFEFPPLWAVA